ncbi:PREDICTED: artemin-like, partial [Chinchilla lanigera]|uniref:artemin-like n=1 Tax=Chinchilla lanigera TaxID=34839 RepID=UPI0006984855
PGVAPGKVLVGCCRGADGPGPFSAGTRGRFPFSSARSSVSSAGRRPGSQPPAPPPAGTPGPAGGPRGSRRGPGARSGLLASSAVRVSAASGGGRAHTAASPPPMSLSCHFARRSGGEDADEHKVWCLKELVKLFKEMRIELRTLCLPGRRLCP